VAYTSEELSDRAEIHDVIVRYAWSIDTRDWDSLDTCFTEDAYVDYSSNPGGREGPYREIRRWLERNLAAFAVMQHLMTNVDITLDGDRATARTMMVNPMGAKTRQGPPHFFYVGGRYDDDFVRTADGWRIAKRVETLLWFEGSLPSELLRGEPA
jgi:3-phenylpropionate/cinnamic acid dioxygenase small subunit